MAKKAKNKYGVPFHLYQIHTVDGDFHWIDIGDESDWGNIQHMTNCDSETFAGGKVPDDWTIRVGWGNDSDGHTEIDEVIDLETEERLDPLEWAESVWEYAKQYAA